MPLWTRTSEPVFRQTATVNNNPGALRYASGSVYYTYTPNSSVSMQKGWVLQSVKTGPVSSANVVGTGTGLSNNSVIEVSNEFGANAVLKLVTHANGSFSNVTIVTGGSGFIDPEYVSNAAARVNYEGFSGSTWFTIPAANITFVANGGGSFTITSLAIKIGGNAGRVHREYVVTF